MQDALIPRKILFGNPDHVGVKTSPDGKFISYIAPHEGVLNLWVAPAENVGEARVVTKDTKRGIRSYFWAYTNQHLLYEKDTDGDENWRLYAVDLTTNKSQCLTEFDKVQARVMQISPDFPKEVLIGLNHRNPEFHDVYRVNITTGELSEIYQNDKYLYFVSDDRYQLRIAVEVADHGGHRWYTLDANHTPELFVDIDFENYLSTSPLGFNKAGDVLYMTDSRDGNTSALVEIDLKTKAKRVIGGSPKADMSDVLIHPLNKTIEAYATTYERKEWTILDKGVEKDLKILKSLDTGELEITSRSHENRIWIAVFLQDVGAPRYYRYDRERGKATFLFTGRAALEGLPLTRMHSEVIPARDGLDLVSYLSIPREEDSKSAGRPSKPLPLILYVHGGPWARDTWGYDPAHQWFANRGYAVLSVNYRGSTGFGKDFVSASYGEWSKKMHDDLLDAVAWAVEQGIADPQKVAIMGGSYGGYATLVGLTFTPEQFACGVDIVGPSNLETLIQSIPPYWKPMYTSFVKKIGGDPNTEEGRKVLAECSPLTHVDKICRPLLIGQGANDPRVKQAESDQIANAMKAKGIPVTYLLYPDEGHGFVRPENRLSFFAVTEAFLAQHLGGRTQPVEGDFEGSTIEFVCGEEITSTSPQKGKQNVG